MHNSYHLTQPDPHHTHATSSNSTQQGDMSPGYLHKDAQQHGSACFGRNCCIQPRLSIKVPCRTGSPLNSWRDKSEELESGSPALHNQVMRLRKEDQQLAEDINEALDTPKDRLVINHLSSQVSDMLVSTQRAVSRSPLGMRTKSWPPDPWNTSILAGASHANFS